MVAVGRSENVVILNSKEQVASLQFTENKKFIFLLFKIRTLLDVYLEWPGATVCGKPQSGISFLITCIIYGIV